MKRSLKKSFQSAAGIALAAFLSLGALPVSAELIPDEIPVEDVVVDGYDTYYPSNYYPSGGSSSDVSDVDLQTALTKVKKRIDIPVHLTEFDYSINTRNGTTEYDFRWSTKDSSSSPIIPLAENAKQINYLSVNIVGDIITSLDTSYTGNNYNNEPKLGKIKPADYDTIIKRGIDKINPGMSADLTINAPRANVRDDSIYASFYRVENGYQVRSNGGNLSFDKDTGAIIGFYVSWWDNADFKDPKTIVKESVVEEQFTKDIDLKAAYIIKKDYSKKKISAEIVYSPSDNYEFDAFTGKKTTMLDDMAKANQTAVPTANPATGASYDDFDVAEDTAEASMDEAVAFSAAERKAIDESSVMISKTKAIELVKSDPYIKLSDAYELRTANLRSSDEFNGKIVNTWHLEFYINTDKVKSSVSVTLDADSGKIKSFSKIGGNYVYYSEDIIEEPVDTDSLGSDGKAKVIPNIDVTAANKTVKEAAEYYFGNWFSEYRADTENTRALTVDPKTKKTIPETARSMTFKRYHDNIIVNGDTMYFTVNSENEILSMNCTYSEVTLPKGDIISEADAYKSLWTQEDFNMYYNGFVAKGKTYTYLMYQLDYFYINARTGKVSDYYGEPVKPDSYAEEDIVYSDLGAVNKNTPDALANIVGELGAYGISIPAVNGKFDAGRAVTEAEFLSLLRNTISYYGDSEINEMSKSNKSLTRKTAAKIYVIMKNGKEFAEIKGIYKSPYTDVSETDEYAGYITLATGLGAFDSTAKTFKPNNNMTREEAIRFMYNLVK
jgi:hypothetical protein